MVELQLPAWAGSLLLVGASAGGSLLTLVVQHVVTTFAASRQRREEFDLQLRKQKLDAEIARKNASEDARIQILLDCRAILAEWMAVAMRRHRGGQDTAGRRGMVAINGVPGDRDADEGLRSRSRDLEERARTLAGQIGDKSLRRVAGEAVQRIWVFNRSMRMDAKEPAEQALEVFANLLDAYVAGQTVPEVKPEASTDQLETVATLELETAGLVLPAGPTAGEDLGRK